MDLHIKDRLLIPSIFPERGNFMDFNLGNYIQSYSLKPLKGCKFAK